MSYFKSIAVAILFSQAAIAQTASPEAQLPAQPNPPVVEAPKDPAPPVEQAKPVLQPQAIVVEKAPEPTAAPNTKVLGKIANILRGQKKAVTEWSSNPPPIDSKVLFTSAKKESCEGKVTEVSQTSTMVSLEQCDILNDLKVGLVVELFSPAPSPVLVPVESKVKIADPTQKEDEDLIAKEAAVKVRTSEKRLTVGVGLYASSASDLKFDDATVTLSGTSYDGTVKYNVNSATGVLIEVASINKFQWGGSVGYSIETKRDITAVEAKFDGETISGPTSGGIAYTLNTVTANASYRWEWVYLHFGINYSLPTVTNPPTALKSIKGALGGQVGINFISSARLVGFFEVRLTNIQANWEGSSSQSSNFGPGHMYNSNIGVKYFFF